MLNLSCERPPSAPASKEQVLQDGTASRNSCHPLWYAVMRDGDLYVESAARHGGRPDWALSELSRVEAGRYVQ